MTTHEMTRANVPDVTIRLITLDDAEQVQRNCMPGATVEQIRARIPGELRAYEAGEVVPLVAVLDGEVVGVATLERRQHRLARHIAEVGGLVVDHRYQRRGVARRLLADVSARAAAMGVELLVISCRGGTPAETVYRRLGFIEYGRLTRGIKEPSGKVFDEVFFYQPLARAAGDNDAQLAR